MCGDLSTGVADEISQGHTPQTGEARQPLAALMPVDVFISPTATDPQKLDWELTQPALIRGGNVFEGPPPRFDIGREVDGPIQDGECRHAGRPLADEEFELEERVRFLV